MVPATLFEKIALAINSLTRLELKRRLVNFKRGNFKLDFTEVYLNRLSVDKLRHILLAATMTKGHA